MIVVGQKLWYVPSYRHGLHGYEITVTKIGRRWATVSGADRGTRIDMATLQADGGEYSSPGQAYLSRDAYENSVVLKEAWRDYCSRLSAVSPPDGMTMDKLEQIKALCADEEKHHEG